MKRLRLALFMLMAAQIARADFDDLGVNARSIAMGGALTGLADDAQSAPLNPAGLGLLRRAEIGSDYGRLQMGLKDNSDLSISHVALGIPIVRVKKEKAIKSSKPAPPPASFFSSVDGSSRAANIDLDGGPAQDATPTWSRKGALAFFYRNFALSGHYQETTLGLAYGKSFGRHWNAGIGIKKLDERYEQDDYTRVDPVFGYGAESSVSAMSFDVGLLFNLMPRVFFGASALDVNQPSVGLKDAENLPMTRKIGIGYRWQGLSAGLDWSERDGLSTYGTGIEKHVKNDSLALRAGFLFGDGSLSVISGGIGFKLGQARLNFASQFPLTGIQGASGSHRVSIVFKFGQPLLQDSEPGSLEQAYLETQEKLAVTEAKLKEIQENRDSLEKVLVEESTLRIQERIDAARTLARSQAKAKEAGTVKDRETSAPIKVNVKTHRVEKGDTLQLVAERYYGDRSKWRIIYDENKDNVGRGGTLRKGQLLIIPPVELGQSMEAAATGAKRSKFSNGNAAETTKAESRSKWSKPEDRSADEILSEIKTHVVKNGDTLQSISQQYYGTTTQWQKIYGANKDKVTRGYPNVGAELLIP